MEPSFVPNKRTKNIPLSFAFVAIFREKRLWKENFHGGAMKFDLF